MLYKILSETSIQQFSGYIESNGLIYTNQLAEEKALESGEWFSLVTEGMPEYDAKTQYLTKQYTQEQGQIRLSWVIHDIIFEENETDDYIEAAKILLGEVNENA